MTDELIWRGIADSIKRISPAIYRSLNPPAGIGAIDGLERKLGIRLPDSFKAYLKTFNGQKPDGLPLCGFNRFLPADEIVSTALQQITLFGDESPVEFLKENKIRTVLWDEQWIPFADFESSNRLIMDLHAGQKGKDGQIIFLYPGVDTESDEVVVASSFRAFGKKLLQRLESSAYEIEDKRIMFTDDWII
jgi:cell wall assembly regulator SMI1